MSFSRGGAANMARGGAGGGKRCPECGVEVKAGVKYCDFCGTKIASEQAVAPVAPTRGGSGRRVWLAVGIVVFCLAISFFAYTTRRLAQPVAPQFPLAPAAEGMRLAVEVCERGIGRLAIAPFRVIAFSSSRVGEEQGGYLVTGTVELQSVTGDLKRQRYYCRCRPEGKGGMALDDAKVY